MKELDSFEEVLKVVNERKDVVVDLSNLNDDDYTKSIDYIKNIEASIKRITRSKFEFIYS